MSKPKLTNAQLEEIILEPTLRTLDRMVPDMKKILPPSSKKSDYRSYLLGYANAMLVFAEELGLNKGGTALEVLAEVKSEQDEDSKSH